jgi:hypothetical protein
VTDYKRYLDEQDVFGSDFESTDEEEEDTELGEKAVRDEERRQHKVN